MTTSISQSKKIIIKGWTFFKYCFQRKIPSVASGCSARRESLSGVFVGSRRAEKQCDFFDFGFGGLAGLGDESCGSLSDFFAPLQLYHIGLECNR